MRVLGFASPLQEGPNKTARRRLVQLKELLDGGLITKEDFENAKTGILASL